MTCPVRGNARLGTEACRKRASVTIGLRTVSGQPPVLWLGAYCEVHAAYLESTGSGVVRLRRVDA